MKIAYILPAFPDQHNAPSGSLRHYHFIRELSQRHSITLFSLTTGDISSQAWNEMASWTEQILTFDILGSDGDEPKPRRNAGLSGRSRRAWKARQAVGRLKSSFEELTACEAFDVVVFHGKHTFPVIARCELPMVIDFCDATSFRMRQGMRYARVRDLPWQILRYLEVKHFEKKLLGKSRHRVFISARDRNALLGPYDRSTLIVNGIDLAYWTRRTRSPQPDSIVYSGVMDYPPNADGALFLIQKILPHIRRSIPNVHVFIVGRKPSPALVEAARASFGITVTGFVEDIRPYLERASVYVAPLRFASGMQNKLLEAMAMEVPVVTTPIGAQGIQIEGLENLPVRVAHGEAQIATSTIELLRTPAEHCRLVAGGRKYVEEHFDWSRSAARLERICMDAIADAV